jgi:coenzyme F420-reducing hydrogenase gamma subunit
MGPVTRAGCGALCPSQGRDCYACFGPSEDPNPDALARRLAALGLERRDVVRRMRGVENWSPAFRAAAQRIEDGDV